MLNDHRKRIALMSQPAQPLLTRALGSDLTLDAFTASRYAPRDAGLAGMSSVTWPIFCIALSAFHNARFLLFFGFGAQFEAWFLFQDLFLIDSLLMSLVQILVS
ncbi:uncharacterized protein CC84DRAFT_441880 [Paraphaeosphaeria sporulosa]|uniref:Uncharacterized protein n=1 Tax=Paraphaeosphaeria sporulosa TaxID=1460663 RepID=A0A177CQV2_9PLEO|nr:uncharacterized protein CC84DRAFT_441880 [Paraphaeosphaeria sporulosa]OAG09601.1 hypothetical protein CC84DRAFT_441880 [Paraphaeosphaeria sporulosa]